MHTTVTHLQSAIRTALLKGELFRVYQDSINACWPTSSMEKQNALVDQFANQNHWIAEHRTLGHLGPVVEFRKAA